jgi:SAM-dependent methyltransferase
MISPILKRAPEVLAPIAVAYGRRLKECGLHPRGVYWKTHEGQTLRFEILLGIIDPRFDETGGIRINDLGCGYGALFELLKDMPAMVGGQYYGYDISEDMVKTAQEKIQDSRASFERNMIASKRADYSIVSGTFNMKMDSDPNYWLDYIKESLIQLWRTTERGLAFNMLSSYEKHKQFGLYYADPSFFFEFCMQNLSKNVTLLHDYQLVEWAIFVHR